MKKIKVLLSVIGLSVAVSAVAQNSSVVRQPEIEMNQSRALWFNSSNVAGMSVAPLSRYSIVDFSYNRANGDFKMQQQGETESVVGFNTNGATTVGKTFLWGNFDYRNIVEDDTKYLTNLFDPQRDMPYYVADAIGGKFKKQSYDLGVKVAFPQLWGFVTPGCELEYNTNTGAKQRDPRSVTYFLNVKAAPSFVFEVAEHHHVGLSVNYEYLFERSTFNRSDTEIDYPVYIMRGLGNYSEAVVSGSVGVGTFFYKGNKIGGALQYGYTGDDFAVLVDGGYSYKVEDAFQTPTKKQNMGSTEQKLWNASVKMVEEGENRMQTISLSYTNRKTDGIEYIQELGQVGEFSDWVTLAKYLRSKYSYQSTDINYEWFIKEGSGYKWKFGVDMIHTKKFDEYILPAAHLKVENDFQRVYAKRNFNFGGGKSSLLAGINLGFNHNVKGEYVYEGSYAESDVVKDMYAKDILYMSSDYITAGGEVTYSTLVNKATSLFVKGTCQYYSPDEELFEKRLYTSLSVGITF